MAVGQDTVLGDITQTAVEEAKAGKAPIQRMGRHRIAQQYFVPLILAIALIARPLAGGSSEGLPFSSARSGLSQ